MTPSQKDKILSWLKISDIHASRLRYAMAQLENKTPVSAETMAQLSNADILVFELYTSRFSKLQDFMGNTLFVAALQAGGEQIEEITFIDKLNKLEKLKLIPSAEQWIRMRQIRNYIAHEYPDHPELTANFFNQAYAFGPLLLSCLDNIHSFLEYAMPLPSINKLT